MTNTKLYLYQTLSDVELYHPDNVDIVRLLGVQLELSGENELDRPHNVDIVRLVDVQLDLRPPTYKEPPDRLTTQVQVGTLSVFNFVEMCMTHNPSLFIEMFMTHNPSLVVEMFMTHNPPLVVQIFINLNPAKTKITLKSLCKTYSISCTLSKLFTKNQQFLR